MQGLRHAGAFVVQFTAATDFSAGLVEGRAEHVASGRAVRFDSAEALLAFVARVLEDIRGRSQRERERPGPGVDSG
jgi:hypothetical protein